MVELKSCITIYIIIWLFHHVQLTELHLKLITHLRDLQVSSRTLLQVDLTPIQPSATTEEKAVRENR